MNKILLVIIRVLVGVFFLALGLLHFYYPTEMAVYVPLPTGAKYFVYLNGILITFSAIAILMNKWMITSLLVIGLTLAISAGMVQLGIDLRNPDEIIKPVAISNLIKLLLACTVFISIIIYQRQKR